MKRGSIVLVVVGVLFAFSGYAKERVNTQKGKELYDKHCASCHGVAAIGQNKDKPYGGRDGNGNLLAPALNPNGHAWHHAPSYLHKYIKDGSPRNPSEMPAYGGLLSDDDIRSIIAYIQSLWSDKLLERYRERFPDEMK